MEDTPPNSPRISSALFYADAAGAIDDDGALDRGREAIVAEFEDELARLEPRKAARKIIKGVRKDRRRILVGSDAGMLDKVQRLLPSGYLGAMIRHFRRRYAVAPSDP